VIAKCKREWVEEGKMERQEFSPRSSRRQVLANAAIVDAKPADLPVQAANQIGCEVGQSVVLVMRPAILDRHILALDVAGFTKALAECGQIACTIGGRRAAEESYYRHRRLLRSRRERPRRGPAERG
jgi:hypothetical protein